GGNTPPFSLCEVNPCACFSAFASAMSWSTVRTSPVSSTFGYRKNRYDANGTRSRSAPPRIACTGTSHFCPRMSRHANSSAARICVRLLYSDAVGFAMTNRISSRRVGSCPTRYGFRPWNAATALSPPPPISPSPTIPSSVSTSTMVRTNRPQCAPLAWRSGAARGTVTGVARMSMIFISRSTRELRTPRRTRADSGVSSSYAAVDAEATVHGNDRAGDEGCRIAAEKAERAEQLLRAAEPPHRRLGDDALGALRVLAIGGQQHVAILRRDEEAGCDRVDAQAVAEPARELDGHPSREAVDPRLGDGVSEDAAQLP